LPLALPRLAGLPGVPLWVLGDKGYASHTFREHIWAMGARPAIPAKSNEEPVARPRCIFGNRNLVEWLWNRDYGDSAQN
jgi:hypothetical protein